MSNDFQVFFTHIPTGTTLDEVKSFFSNAGSVKGARFGRDEKYGFVSFYSQQDAEKAVATLHKKEPLNLRVDWPKRTDGSSAVSGNTSRAGTYRDDRSEDSFSMHEPSTFAAKSKQQQSNNGFFDADSVPVTATAAAPNGNIDEYKINEILNYLVRVRDQAFIEHQNRMAREYVRKNFASLQAVHESFGLIANNLEMLTIGKGAVGTVPAPVKTTTTTQNGFKEPKWTAPASSSALGHRTAASSNGTMPKREYSSYDNNNRNQEQQSFSDNRTGSFNGKRSKPYPTAGTHDECDSWDDNFKKNEPKATVPETITLDNGTDWEDETPAVSSSSLKTSIAQYKSLTDDILKNFGDLSLKKSSSTKETSPALETDLNLSIVPPPPPPKIELNETKTIPEEKVPAVVAADVTSSPRAASTLAQRKFSKSIDDFIRVKATAIESQQTGHIILVDSMPTIAKIERSLMDLKPERNFVPKIGQICAYCESDTKRYRVQIMKSDRTITAKMIDNGRIINGEPCDKFIDMADSEFSRNPIEAIKIEIRNPFKLSENLEFEAKYCFENPDLNLVVIDARYLEEKKMPAKLSIRSFVYEKSPVSSGYIEIYGKYSDKELIASCVADELQDQLTVIENDALQSIEDGFKANVNDICYGLRPNNEEWLRCKVLKVNANGSYLMALLDYGLTETCTRVRPISPAIFDIPHFSVLIECDNVSAYENKTYYFDVLSKSSGSFEVAFADEAGGKTDESFTMKPFRPDLAYNHLQ